MQGFFHGARCLRGWFLKARSSKASGKMRISLAAQAMGVGITLKLVPCSMAL